MTVDTHCLPTGTFAPFQIPVNQAGADTVTISDATGGAGHRRGICVWLHPSQNSDLPLPLPVPNAAIGESFQVLQNALNNDGWVFAYPAYPFDWSVNGVSYFGNLFNDVANDLTFGERVVNTLLLWWDHLLDYLASLYGTGRPIFVGGFSLGGWATLQVALGRTSTLKGYIAHCPATIWEDIFSSNTSGFEFNTIDCSGIDLSPTALNGLTIPGIVGYSNNDATVGWTNNRSQTSPMPWEKTTISSVNMVSGEDFIVSGGFTGVTQGMRATVTSGAGVLASGTTVFQVNGDFCGVSPNVVTSGTGCTVTFDGPLSNAYPMVQAAIGAGRPVTAYNAASSSVGGLPVGYPFGHLFISDTTSPTLDAAEYTTWVASTLDPHYPVSF